MNERLQRILAATVQEYVKTAEPVASSTIASNYRLDVSPATIRNDMAVLEEEGYLRQPHTSSGRVPTEEGYRFYLQLIRQHSRKLGARKELREVAQGTDEDMMQGMARALSQISGETALVSLDASRNQTTGISNLFSKPDFQDVETLRTLSHIVDRLDEVMKTVFDDVEKEVRVFIGNENPFGKEVATIVAKYRLPSGATGMIGLMGPMRMDYEKNLQLLEEVRAVLDQSYGRKE